MLSNADYMHKNLKYFPDDHGCNVFVSSFNVRQYAIANEYY